jgi:hypothetical protein
MPFPLSGRHSAQLITLRHPIGKWGGPLFASRQVIVTWGGRLFISRRVIVMWGGHGVPPLQGVGMSKKGQVINAIMKRGD